jgi:RNA processing factor Prp31
MRLFPPRAALLDDLDKEANTYAMRVKEWYGWHFPELSKVVNDNILFAKCVKAMGNAPPRPFSCLPLNAFA